jgi:23S rRNA (cytidine2498-2'-O)-methyltransferase
MTNLSSVLISPSEREVDLEAEIQRLGGTLREKRGRLFIVDNLSREPAFAQNIWYNPQWIEFDSVSDGAKKLSELGGLWSLHSIAHHRRSELIENKLRSLRNKPLVFPQKAQFPKLGAWSLWEPQKLLAATNTRSVFHNGEPLFKEESEWAPSRAYLKLWEWMTITQKFPKAGSQCLDLGSSPGGWTWVLSELGCNVISVDKAPLDPRLAAQPLIRWMKKDAFQLLPEDIGPVDWLFSDIICYPPKLYELVQTWLRSGLIKNFVCTIKFQGKTDFQTLDMFRKIPGSEVLHLSANRHEVTWFCLEKDS